MGAFSILQASRRRSPRRRNIEIKSKKKHDAQASRSGIPSVLQEYVPRRKINAKMVRLTKDVKYPL